MSRLKEYGALLLLLASSFHVSFAGLLKNGHFEEAPNPTQMSGTKVNGKHSIPYWETNDGYVEYIRSGYKQGDMLLVVPQGRYAVRLGNEASIKQTVQLKKGTFYALTFSFARTCAQEEKLNVSVSPTSEPNDWGILPLQTMYSSIGFDSYAWGFLAEEESVEITLHNPGRDEDPACGPLIDTVAINVLRPPHLTPDNLIKNGNFEEGPYVFHKSTWGVLIPPNIEDDHSPLPAWMIESLKAVKYIDSPHFSVPVGSRAIELVAGKESALAQIIRTKPGQTYSLTFALGDAGNGCVGPMEVEAFAGKYSVKSVYESKGKGGFVRAQLRFKADKDRTRVRFLSSVYSMTIEGSLCGPVIDDVRVVRAP
ncbi:hypothetical protein V2J09_023513 [Rumex salicifolius]